MVSKITTPPTQNEVIDKVNELVDDKQDTLVSGTNIKTVNGTSLLGSGNIDIVGKQILYSTTGNNTDGAMTQKATTTELNNKADIDLSNLTLKGQNIANWSTNVTNCITEIPQDIKLELNNGTLTLKAGSKLYVPNRFESDGTTPKFDVVTLTRDLFIDKWNNTAPGLISMTANRELWTALLGQQFSGSSAPTTQYALWYDTTNNIIKSSSNAGSSWKEGYCLPIAICTSDSSKWTSINQVFNGFGYIGSTVFALPGVKGLIPNGRNADGSLKNIEFTTSSVLTYTRSGSATDVTNIAINKNNLSYHTFVCNDVLNTTTAPGFMNAGDIIYTSGIITSLTPKTAFHAVDYNDFSDLKDTVDTNVVHKTGDETISGLKTIDHFLLFKKSPSDFSVAPQNPLYTEIRNVDVNGYEIGQFRVWKDTDGANVIDLLGRYQHGTANVYGANLGVKTYADGTSFAYTNASDINNSIVTTINKSKSANGYFKLGNGLIIQWGRSSQRTFTYPIPFSSDTSFSIVVNNQAGTNGYGRPDSVDSLNRTSCMVTSLAEYPVRWIAIGY